MRVVRGLCSTSIGRRPKDFWYFLATAHTAYNRLKCFSVCPLSSLSLSLHPLSVHRALPVRSFHSPFAVHVLPLRIFPSSLRSSINISRCFFFFFFFDGSFLPWTFLSTEGLFPCFWFFFFFTTSLVSAYVYNTYVQLKRELIRLAREFRVVVRNRDSREGSLMKFNWSGGRGANFPDSKSVLGN